MTTQQRKKKCVTCLPQDIVGLILVRLPVNTLLRCRSVCKQWDGIIRDPQFIMAHLHNAPRQPLLFFQRTKAAGKLYPSEAVLFDEAWSPSRRNVPVIEPDDFLCASCNGLICLYSSKSTIKIANLATGECMHLTKPVKNSKDDHFSFYSFGFHPATKEYKVMHFLREEQLSTGGPISVIQVYTLGDEKWRDVRTAKALSLNCVEHSGVVNVEGAMYWLTEDIQSSWRRAVVSFDLNDERLELIQLPAVDFANAEYGDPLHYRITEIDGNVSVATIQTRRDSGLTGKLQIWTLDNKVCALVLGVDINLELPPRPDQDMSPRRPNWLEQRRVKEMLVSFIDSLEGTLKVMEQAMEASNNERKKTILAGDQGTSTSTPTADNSGL